MRLRTAALSLFAAVLIALTACTAQFQPMGPSHNSPDLTDTYLVMPDGQKLPFRLWPAVQPRAVVLALHGMNDYSNFMDLSAQTLVDQGITLYAYDQRGFGQTEKAGIFAGAATLAQDARTAISLIRQAHPDLPLYLLGESMGGAVAILAAQGLKPGDVDGVILSAPGVWGPEEQGFFQTSLLWLAYQIAPGWTLTGEGLKIQASDNIDMLLALGRDPLVIKGTRIDAIYGLVQLMGMAQNTDIHLPMLLLYGAKDEIIPPGPVRQWAEKQIARNPQVKSAFYPNGWHMLMRDLQARVVMDDIAHYILAKDKFSPLPSGADREFEAFLRQN